MATPTEIMAVNQLRALATQAEIIYRSAKRLDDLWLALNISIPVNGELFEDGNTTLPLSNNDVVLLTYLASEIKDLFEANNDDKLRRVMKASTAPSDWR
jgi:hypothetical protein